MYFDRRVYVKEELRFFQEFSLRKVKDEMEVSLVEMGRTAEERRCLAVNCVVSGEHFNEFRHAKIRKPSEMVKCIC